MTESRTPITDAEALKWGPHDGQMNVVIPTHFARRLELALAQAENLLRRSLHYVPDVDADARALGIPVEGEPLFRRITAALATIKELRDGK